jgi:hypothetical protein
LGEDFGMAAPPVKQLTDEFRILLGSIVESWAYVDAIVNEMLSFMCRADPGSMYAITQTVAASSVSSWVRTLVEVKFTDDSNRQTILDLLTEIDGLRAERNIVVHGLWNMDATDDAAIVQTMRWDRREVTRFELMTRSDMEDLRSRIDDARLRIGRLGLFMGFLKAES